MSRRNVTTKEVEQNVQYLLDNMSGEGGNTANPLEIKTITYVGNGEGTNVITFIDEPKIILSVFGEAPDGNYIRLGVPIPFVTHKGGTDNVFTEGNALGYGGHAGAVYEVDATAKTLTFKRDDDIGACFNGEGKTYTVYYI